MIQKACQTYILKQTTTQQTALSSSSPKQPKPMPLEGVIINRIRMSDSISLPAMSRLIKAAQKTKRLKIHIGIDGGVEEKENEEHPTAPTYYYNGSDVTKLEPLLVNENTILKCSATLVTAV